MPENRYDFRYTPQDVASAQRSRLLSSTQLRIILFVGLGTLLYLAAPLIVPSIIPPQSYSSWALVLQVGLAYVVTLLVLTLLMPWFTYYFNRFWRLPLALHFNDKQLRISVSGKPGGLRLAWRNIQRVQENKRVFILEYGAGGKYVILPKSVFTKAGVEKRFRNLLDKRATAPLPEPETKEEKEPAA